MANSDILRALLERLNAYSTSLPVAYLGKQWNGESFVPPSSGMWLESSYMPNEPDDVMWTEAEAMQMGLFQVDVRFRSDTTEPLAQLEADKIVAHFAKGFQLDGAVRVEKRPYVRGRVTDEANAYVPVIIPYRGMG